MEEENNPLESILNNVTSVASGIPAPIQKNLFKAFAQLCSASVDIPVSYLEGQAAIRRANTEARVKVIAKISENLSTNIDVPVEYSDKAIERYASKIVKQQINLDRVVNNAATNLNNQNYIENAPEKEISEEWLNVFEEAAKIRSNEDMQMIFGEILANEIHRPGSFSYRTLNVVSQLEYNVSQIFLKLCSAAIYLKTDDIMMIAVTSAFEKSNDLDAYDILHYDKKFLEDYGLLHTSSSQFDLDQLVDAHEFIYIGKTAYKLISIDDKQRFKSGIKCTIFTEAGKELFGALSVEANSDFFENAKSFLEQKGVSLIEI